MTNKQTEIADRIRECPDKHGIYPIQTAARTAARYDFHNCNIALIDADLLDSGTRHPNLVLMKLSRYFKNRGCTVRLIENYRELYLDVGMMTALNRYDGLKQYDAVYVSKVFDYTKIDRRLLSFDHVYFGGTGFYFDHAPALPGEIEHTMPDYHLYDDFIAHDKRKNKKRWYKDYLYFSIGFLTRGCFRQCKFCVNHSCSEVRFHSHLSEWFDESRKYICYCDDNVLGYSKWQALFDELNETGKPFQFKQGLDMRLMTPKKADVLSQAKYYHDYIFAFDHLEDADWMEKKLDLWRQYTDKETKLYVLSGFDGQDEREIISIFERIRILMKYGCVPYIMRHEKYLDSPYKGMFVQLARWCNQPGLFKKMSFRQFVERNQREIKTDRISNSMKVMRDFENRFPDIANRYFDLRFAEQPYVIEREKKKASTSRHNVAKRK
jgi:hypothetical protein